MSGQGLARAIDQPRPGGVETIDRGNVERGAPSGAGGGHQRVGLTLQSGARSNRPIPGQRDYDAVVRRFARDRWGQRHRVGMPRSGAAPQLRIRSGREARRLKGSGSRLRVRQPAVRHLHPQETGRTSAKPLRQRPGVGGIFMAARSPSRTRDANRNKTSTNRRRANRIRFFWERRVKKVARTRIRRDALRELCSAFGARFPRQDVTVESENKARANRIGADSVGTRVILQCPSAPVRPICRDRVKRTAAYRRRPYPATGRGRGSGNKARANRGRRDSTEPRRVLQLRWLSARGFPRHG